MERVTKHKYLIFDVQASGQPFISFEIGLPSNLKEVHGITLTNTCFSSETKSIGTLALQSQDETDVFLIKELYSDDVLRVCEFEEQVTGMASFPSDFTFIKGNTPKELPVSITAKTAVITGWYKPADSGIDHRVRIYLRYEEQ